MARPEKIVQIAGLTATGSSDDHRFASVAVGLAPRRVGPGHWKRKMFTCWNNFSGSTDKRAATTIYGKMTDF